MPVSHPATTAQAPAPAGPEIKASYFAGTLASLEVLGPDAVAKARERLPHVFRGFDGLSRLGWVPLQWDLEVSRLVAEIGGLGAVRITNRQALLSAIDGPLLRPFVQTGVSLWGPSPRTFLRFIARVWQASTRDLGSIVVAGLDDHSATLSLVELPPAALDGVWLEGFCGLVEGIYETTHHHGQVPSPRVANGQAVFELTWSRALARRRRRLVDVDDTPPALPG